MADSTTKIVFAADASGAIAAIGQAQKSLSDFGIAANTAGDKAAAGLDKAGMAADAAARKVKTAQDSINRIAIDSTFGRDSPEALLLRARQKGLNDADVAPQIANLIRLREAKASAAAEELRQLEQVRQAKVKAAQLDSLTTSLGATNFVKPRVQVPGDLSAATTSLGAAGLRDVEKASATAAVATTLAGAAAQRSGIQFNEYGLSAKQTAAALRQVPAQITDIVVSLQGGQKPLTVLLQQGGQLKDIFGGIRPAAEALGRAVLGFINPFTIAAGVIGVLTLAYKLGAEESDAYAKALILSGNAAGSTVGKLQSMAKGISAVVGSQAGAAEALAQFAASGDIANGSLQRFATAAIRMERVTGQSIADTVKNFASLTKDPLASTLKLNEGVNFLTESLYRQIKALEDEGRTAEASAVAQRGYAEALEARAGALEGRLGTVEKAWLAVKDAAKAAWSAMLDVGRAETTDSRLAKVQAEIEKGRAAFDPSNFGGNAAARARLQENQQLAAQLGRRLVLEGDIAAASAASNAQLKARIEFDKEGLKYPPQREEQLRRAIKVAQDLGAAAGATPQEIAQRIADIKEKFKPPKGREPENIGKALLQSDLDALKLALGQEVDLYRNAESILEAVRAAGLVDDKAYFAAKAEFVRINSEAQEKALIDEIARREVEDSRLQGEARKAVEAINNRAAIADAEEKLAKVRLDTSAKLQVLSIQDAARIDALARSYRELTISVEQYLDKFRLQNEREAAAVGKGTRRDEFDRGLAAIEDKGTQERDRLDAELRNGRLRGKQDQYDQELALLKSSQARELAEYKRGFAAVEAARRDFTNGATRAAENYITDISDIAKYTENLFTDAFKGMEDALVEFVTHGRLSFKSLADTIVADITRIIIKQQIANAIAAASPYFSAGGGGSGFSSFLGSLLGGSGKVSGAIGGGGGFGAGSTFGNADLGGFLAGGGPARAGTPYIVGEQGPELFVPSTPGRVLSTQDSKTALTQGNQITVTVNQTFAANTTRATVEQAAAETSRHVRRAMARGTA